MLNYSSSGGNSESTIDSLTKITVNYSWSRDQTNKRNCGVDFPNN